jgi:endogenous inhibitor of DNA gyrase (YacG/DUF329 family)
VKTPRLVACPTCGAQSPFVAANPWRPFCSERCRSIDLGGWASEAYSIPARDEDAGEGDAGPEGR